MEADNVKQFICFGDTELQLVASLLNGTEHLFLIFSYPLHHTERGNALSTLFIALKYYFALWDQEMKQDFFTYILVDIKLPMIHSGGSRISRWGGRRPVGGGGHRPPTRTLFGKNICENERNGSCWGAPAAPPWIRQ